MAYTETKTTSYGQRLGGSAKGVGMGIILFIAGTVLLWWNEGRAVKTTAMLNQAQSETVHVDDVSALDPGINGKLIHATALTVTHDSLSDPQFGVGAVAVRLNRTVEFYQWSEESSSSTKDKIGGGQETVTTYTYSKGWTSTPQKSSDFHDPQYQASNFVISDIENATYQAQNVQFGAYRLPSFLISSITGDQPASVSLSPELLQQLDSVARKAIAVFNSQTGVAQAPVQGDTSAATTATAATVPATATTTPATVTNTCAHVVQNVLYLGQNPSVPNIGDVRITFTKVLPAEVSIVAQVSGDTFQVWTAKEGGTFSTLVMGVHGIDEIFASAHQSNKFLTWILRIIGVVVVVYGLKQIFGLLIALLKVLPFLANIVNLGINLVCWVIGVVWSLIIIAIAWIAHRPVLGISLLVIVVALIVFLAIKGKKKKEALAAQPVEPQQPTQTNANPNPQN